MKAKKILLVDDDTDLGGLITSSLIVAGYDVHYQTSLAGIENTIEAFNPSILILDVEIGQEDGITRAKSILRQFPRLPVLFISSHTETPDVVRGVIAGGVGYIRKPFDMTELQAYIERFSSALKLNDLSFEIGSYTLNTRTRELHLNSAFIKQLSRMEFQVLQILLENKNGIVSHEVLSKKIWNKEYREAQHTLNNVISKLRKAFNHSDEVNIRTLKDNGYKITVC